MITVNYIGFVKSGSRHTYSKIKRLEEDGCSDVLLDSDLMKIGPNYTWSSNLLQQVSLQKKSSCIVVCSFGDIAENFEDLVLFMSRLETEGIFLKTLDERIDTTKTLSFSGYLKSLVPFVDLCEKRRGLGKGGRPPKLKESDIALARRLLAEPGAQKKQVASKMGISRVTLNNYLAQPISP